MKKELKEILSDLTEYLKENKPKYLYNQTFIPGKSQVLYSGPYWDEQEIMAGINTFVTGKWVVAGENVRKFELEFAKMFNVKYTHMVNSGSSANLVLIGGLKKHFGWEDGDEIIVSPVGFPTTISTLVQNNLVPVFVDIEYDTLNFDVHKIEEKITSKTKAIFVSPVLGNAPDMDFLSELCSRKGIKLVGDSCDSLGSKWDGKDLSSYYVAWSSSFYPAHHISTGEGGIVCTDIADLKKLFVSLSWWGRDCHTSGTTLYTIDGVKNIEDIKVGDKVFTHLGNYKNVYDIMVKKYSGDLYKFTSRRNETIESTHTHPFYIKRGDNYSWVFAQDIVKGDYLVRKIPEELTTPSIFTVEYDTLVRKESFNVDVDKDLFRLIGYWLAEGSLASGNRGSIENKKGKYKYYRVDFSFNINEKIYIQNVCDIMKKHFNTSPSFKYKGNGVTISFKSRKGYEFFNKYCGQYSNIKKIPYEFVHYNKVLLKELIKGYWRGDGSDTNGELNSYTISTTSKNLYNQIRLILNRFDISPGINVIKKENRKSNFIVKSDLYTLTSYGYNYRNFAKLVDEEYSIKENRNLTDYFDNINGYSLHEITDIYVETVENLDVYNCEVEDDHSFHANGIASHNCHCVGSANLLPCGTCGNRFDNWLESYDGIIDHKYVFTNMGYNLKPLDLQGSIGLVQLTRFKEIDEKRKHSKSTIESILLKYVKNLKGVEMLDKSDTCWFGTPFICEDKALKDKLVGFLEKNKIQTRNYFAGNILMHPGYKHLDDLNKYPNANKVLDKVFFLGAAPHYDEPVFEYIENIFKEKWIN